MLGINRRETGLGFTVLVVFVALFYAYLSADKVAQKELDAERIQARLAARSLEAGAKVQDLHRSVESFLLTRDAEDVEDFEIRMNEVFKLMNSFNGAEDAAGITAIRGQLVNYANYAGRIITLSEKLGLSHNEGLEGRLRHAVHAAEEVLALHNKRALMVDLLMLRRHEKDFMMRQQQKYIDLYDARMLTFHERLETCDIVFEEREMVADAMRAYADGFHDWAKMRMLLSSTTETALESYHQIVDMVAQMSERQIVAAEIKSRRRAAAQYRTDTILVLMIIVMLASGGMLVAMVMRYRRFSGEVETLANMDALTALPNRRGFFKLFEARLEECRVSHCPLVVGVIDLDGFKAVNDIFGHGAGDQLLTETGERLRKVVGPKAVIGRMGGDEFGLILTGVETYEEILLIGRRICAVIAAPYDVKEGVARVTGSIGFASFPQAGATSQILFERADYALYHSKKNSRGEPVLFSQEHESEIRDASIVEQKLLEADENEFHVVYQPIVDSVDGRVAGMEALARWTSPTLGAVRPDVFIRAAEQNGVVTRLTAVLLEKALKSAKSWPDDIYLSFNLSALDLASPESAMRLVEIIRDSNFAPTRLFLEITETAIMQDVDRARASLALFTRMGVRIAMDDFGTGYSSLGYLQRMPIDRLKIDRSFTEGLETKKATRDIMRSVIHLCENLDIDCVVEGIEDRLQIEILHDMGARYIQGYYFSRPMNEADTLDFLGADEAEALNDWVAVA